MLYVALAKVSAPSWVPSLINDIRGIVYAPEYPEQIRDLVWESEQWKSTIPNRIDVYVYLDSLDFSKCQRDCMIALSLRNVYSHVGLDNPSWKNAVKRAHKELLSRGLDADRQLIGMVRKENVKTINS